MKKLFGLVCVALLCMSSTSAFARGGFHGGFHGGFYNRSYGGFHYNRNYGGYSRGWIGPVIGLGILGALGGNYYNPNVSVWYWCDATQSFYPYTPVCPSGFRAVPAQ